MIKINHEVDLGSIDAIHISLSYSLKTQKLSNFIILNPQCVLIADGI